MENKREETKRIPYFDHLKGILILLVVLGHFLLEYQSVPIFGMLAKIIYIFHMPAFLFVSGYLSKSENARNKRSILYLLSAYLIFNSLYMLFSYIHYHSSISLTTPYYSLWYLLAMVVFRLTVERVSNLKYALPISFLLSLLAGFCFSIDNTFSLARIICFYPFFLGGYKLKDELIHKLLEKRNISYYIKGIFVLAFSIACMVYMVTNYDIAFDMLMMYPYVEVVEFIYRFLFLSISALMIVALFLCCPAKKIPFLAKWGKNSLAIFLVHRIITLLVCQYLPIGSLSLIQQFIFVFLLTLLTLLICGMDFMQRFISSITNQLTDLLLGCAPQNKKVKQFDLIKVTASILVFILLAIPVYDYFGGSSSTKPISESTAQDHLYPKLSISQLAEFENDIKISFTGDLILLADMVKDAATETGYDFSPMFEYTKKYLEDSDLAIGVFEGPTAGAEVSYSSSNFDDSLPLYLNYPDEFALAVKDAGYDLVTTANNHLLDKDVEGALRTLDVLDEISLDHVGSYRNETEKNEVKIIEIDGVRFAFLAYTYGSNDYDTKDLFFGENSYLTSVLADPSDDFFDDVVHQVEEDFVHAKSYQPDVIVVLPHMGTQFSHTTDTYQDTWNDIFIKNGANIILGDHSHAVQPIEFKDNALIVNCPGNYVNSYREEDGDCTAIAEVYINRDTKQITGCSVIPLFVHSQMNGIYRALPIYDIYTDDTLQSQISTDDRKRISAAQDIITKVMLGSTVSVTQLQERYYLTPDGYFAQPVAAMELSGEEKASSLYQMLHASKSVCFLGDSVTEGTKNGGYGWYEPLTACFPELSVYSCAKGGATVSILLDMLKDTSLPACDTYVVAIGTNDIRYHREDDCALTKDSYINAIESMTRLLLTYHPNANIVYVAPWMALDNDPFCTTSFEERDASILEYSIALQEYCKQNDYLYLNANPYIADILKKHRISNYLLDHIHPNARDGINMYSRAVLHGEEN